MSTDLFKDSLQLIFFGAPGTGKSYEINKCTKKEDVIRTTFHPDSDYASFVGAYKPTIGELPIYYQLGDHVPRNQSSYKQEQIVYEFVAQSFLNAYIEAWKKYADAKGKKKLKKQYLVIEEINRGNCAQIFGDLFQLLDRYEEGDAKGFSEYPIKPDADIKRKLEEEFRNDKNLKNLTKSRKKAIIAIKELQGNDIINKVISGEILLLPSNLYIWATMNTSDQSLFPVDSAFKRRWDWKYMPILEVDEDWVIEVDEDNYSWWQFLEAINTKIEEITDSEDKKLGYFFCKAKEDVISVETFVSKVIFYLWNDVFKDYEFENKIFKDEDDSKLSFSKFYTKDGIDTEKVIRFLKNLGLEALVLNDDGATSSKTGKNYSKYSLNGLGAYNKGDVVFEAVKMYANNNKTITDIQIVNDWMNLNINNMPHLVEIESVHINRRNNTKEDLLKFDKRSNSYTLTNGQIIYISNQFTLKRINELIDKLNNKSAWKIKIKEI